MICPQCGYENREDARFCGECAASLGSEIPCPSCGRSNPAGQKFCDACAQPLVAVSKEALSRDPLSYTPRHLAEKILQSKSALEGERKIVSVLFADVANYTTLAEKLDPEEVHQIMDGCFQILMEEIHKYEGTINQFTGDGVMALFGAPLAHEDHAQRACHAALSIQKAMAQYEEEIREQHGAEFKLRFGLNSGPVVVGSIGDDLRMDYTAVGDTTNLAHRMQDMANPGTVLVSDPTHRMARDFFEFAFLGKFEVKGKEERQEAYELIRPTEVATRIEAAAARGLTRFVGRSKEMGALREAFDKARSGSGQVIGIVGEAGVGKSRLLLELRRTLPEEACSYLEHRCLHYGGSMPYLPIVEALKTYFDIEEDDQEATIKKKIRDRLWEFGDKPEAVPPSLHEVLSLKVEDEKYLQLGPQQRRERTFEAIRDLLIRESQRRPLVLAFEDLHWIDKTSQEFLDYLIGFLPTASVLLILLYRPEYSHPWSSKSYYGKIGLDQLSGQTSMELVQAILDGVDVAPEIAGLVLGKAGGNPLFVEELTHSLVENGSIQRRDDRFVLTRRPAEIEVPDTIQGIIASRMDRIEENLKRVMQVASVIGREFAYRILHAITGRSEDLKASLLNLQGLEFIHEKQLFPESEYIFKHALTQEVAYNSLLVKRRKEIHEKIGQAIENLYSERLEEYYELVAYHYERSGNKEKAVEYLALASQKAAGACAMEEAKRYFEKGMEFLDALPDNERNRERRISLLVNQWEVFEQLFQVPDYYEILKRYDSLTSGVGNPGLRGALHGLLGFCQMYFGSFEPSIQPLTEAAELCLAAGNPKGAALAYTALVYVYMVIGDFGRTLAMKENTLRKMGEQLDLRLHMRVLGGATRAYLWLGRWDEAVEESEKAVAAAHEFSDYSAISAATWNISFAYTQKGDLAQALKYGEFAVEKAQTPADKAWAQAYLACARCRAGELDKGVASLAGIIELFREGNFVMHLLFYLPFLGEAYSMAGDHNEARRTIEELLELAERCGARPYRGWAHRLLGEIALKTHPDQAPPHFEKAISIFQEIKAENDLALTYSGMGRLYKQAGDVEQARDYLTKALEIFDRLGTLLEPEKVRKELAALGCMGETRRR